MDHDPHRDHLLMTLQFKDGQILFVGGQIAMDPACCCVPTCRENYAARIQPGAPNLSYEPGTTNCTYFGPGRYQVSGTRCDGAAAPTIIFSTRIGGAWAKCNLYRGEPCQWSVSIFYCNCDRWRTEVRDDLNNPPFYSTSNFNITQLGPAVCP